MLKNKWNQKLLTSFHCGICQNVQQELDIQIFLKNEFSAQWARKQVVQHTEEGKK